MSPARMDMTGPESRRDRAVVNIVLGVLVSFLLAGVVLAFMTSVATGVFVLAFASVASWKYIAHMRWFNKRETPPPDATN